jgi:hypothetical protein
MEEMLQKVVQQKMSNVSKHRDRAFLHTELRGVSRAIWGMMA